MFCSIVKQENRRLVMLKNQLLGPQVVVLKISLMKKNQKVFEIHNIKIFVE